VTSEPVSDFHPDLDRPLDHVRLIIGDIGKGDNPKKFLRANQTIIALLAAPISFNGVLVTLLTGLIGEFAIEATRLDQENGLNVEWKDRLASWETLLSSAKKGEIPDPTGKTIKATEFASQQTFGDPVF